MNLKKTSWNAFAATVRFLLKIIFVNIYRIDVQGQENIPEKGSIIVAPNHKSYFDPPLVSIAFKKRLVHYMAKAELFKNPFFAKILRICGAFPVKRGRVDQGAIRTAVKLLKDGHILGIFPEGTRIRKEELGKFHSGVASIAMLTGTSILPIAVVGSMTMPKRGKNLAILVGKPVQVNKEKPDSEKIKILNEKVKSEIEKLIKDYNDKQ
ncbi:lysophospholipid acyltransferase family protein [Dialister micraerophilus]|uniref:lysophospholipid acyltransferase family protein n=1 Tax=Dialister micraerophilus TaxID=309120 RepID=UPI0023F4F0ED|nr:lysophospholipid acyltransferase family protein [Dialister micraerophilus]